MQLLSELFLACRLGADVLTSRPGHLQVLGRSGRQHGTTCRASLFDDIDRDMDAMMRNMEAQMQQAEAQMNALTRSAQGQNAHHSSSEP